MALVSRKSGESKLKSYAVIFSFAFLGAIHPRAGYSQEKLEDRLGVPLGMTTNTPCSGSSDDLGLTAQVASFDAILPLWSETRALEAIVVQRANAARSKGLKVMLAVSPTKVTGFRTDIDLPTWVESACGLTAQTASFNNDCLRRQFIADATNYAAAVQPDYFHLATEINTLWLRRVLVDPDDLEIEYFGTLYQEAYDAIKAVAPQTKVFVSYLHELQVELERSTPGSWDVTLNLFRGPGPASKLDYVGYTSYPSSSGFLSGNYGTPVEIPLNFYAGTAGHLASGERVVFTEIGWPTAGSGTETEQRAFLDRLPDLMESANPALVTWALLHDLPSGSFGWSPELTTVAVRRCDGSAKPGWVVLTGTATVNPPAASNTGVTIGSTGGRGVVHLSRSEKAQIQATPSGAGQIRIRIFTMSGVMVREFLFDSTGPTDPNNTVLWDGTSSDGNRVAAGIYLTETKGPGINVRKKLAILK